MSWLSKRVNKIKAAVAATIAAALAAFGLSMSGSVNDVENEMDELRKIIEVYANYSTQHARVEIPDIPFMSLADDVVPEHTGSQGLTFVNDHVTVAFSARGGWTESDLIILGQFRDALHKSDWEFEDSGVSPLFPQAKEIPLHVKSMMAVFGLFVEEED